MRILFLTDNFPPEVNAPASRTFEHCVEWVRSGHQVQVITCAPNFPAGRVLPGYRNGLYSRESMQGIEVLRVWSYITANEGFLRRTLDYLSYMLSASVAGLFVRRPDIIVGTSPQFFTACAAWLVGLIRRRPYVFEVRDLWPASIRAVGAMGDGPLLRLLERVELFLYRRARGIVSVTHSFLEDLVGRGVPPAKIEVVTNGVDLHRFSPRDREPELARALGLEGKFVAGYVGTLGMAHGLETVLDAARIASDWPDADRFRFVFLGDGACRQHLAARARSMALRNVLFLDPVPKQQVARYWSLLDASIIHLRPDELFQSVIPSKLFECMGMGIPVLHGVPGESARIVQRDGVGLSFGSGDAAALAGAVRRLADDPALVQTLRSACVLAAPAYERGALARRMMLRLEQWAKPDVSP